MPAAHTKIGRVLGDFARDREHYGDYRALHRLGIRLDEFGPISRLRDEHVQTEIQKALADIDVSEVTSVFRTKLGQLEQVVFTASNFQFEEVVLMLTLRVQIEAILTLPTLNIDRPAQLAQIDEELSSLRGGDATRSTYSSAQAAIRSNRPELANHWLLSS